MIVDVYPRIARIHSTNGTEFDRLILDRDWSIARLYFRILVCAGVSSNHGFSITMQKYTVEKHA